MSKYPNIQPLGKIVVTTAGTPVLLSTNCGPMAGGASGSSANPPLPGSAFRAIVLQSPATGNTLNVYLLPRGNTATGNPGNIIGILYASGSTLVVPYVGIIENGILPENFVLDADTSGNFVYGYGIY